ncbi:type II secretion system minor pseudopilin GspI [Ideonella oryzae]|uniref:Type II secretion system protein I n=1 Tax=Ideonella oryzae TaxID=2937441 RepID=A0ABT1BLY0_9BURK|nr:type II secretion system minor pseudopilin GspI [Ideonella oryzae]
MNPRRPLHATGRGFTLVEVLVAVAIVAIALAAGSRAAGSLLGNAQRLSDVTLSQWCATNVLTSIKLAKQYPDIGTSSGECEELGRTFTNTVKVQATLNPNFRRADVVITDEAGVNLVTLSTVLSRY